LELALENQEDLEEELLSRMAWNYIQLYISEGHLQDAYDCLLDTLTYDRQYGLSDVSVLMTLADVCERLGRKKESANFIDGNFKRITDLVNLLLREWILTREFLAEMALANFNDFSETFLCIATFLNTTAQF